MTSAPAGETVVRGERAFLAMCLSQGKPGREYLAQVGDDHLSSAALRRVRDHLMAHAEDPLAHLPSDDPSLSALVTEITMLAEEEPSSEPVLHLSFLQLELRRIERQLRGVREAGDLERQRELYAERERVRKRLDEVMGETE